MDKEFHKLMRDRGEISVRYDPKTEAIWSYANPSLRPCFNISLLGELRQLQLDIIDYFKHNDTLPDGLKI